MSSKKEVLTKKEFINNIKSTGIIPSDYTIDKIVNEKDRGSNEPLLNPDEFKVLNYNNIKNTIADIISDVDILYDVVNVQSRKIFEQITNSSKEYRGIKNTLKRIDSEARDINAGANGIDKAKYVFIEDFSSYDTINLTHTTVDEDFKQACVDIDSGIMYLPSNKINNIDMSHYYGKKLDVVPTNYNGTVIGSDYTGDIDVGVILDSNNDKYLQYNIYTSDATEINLSFVLQLKRDGSKTKLNHISAEIDSNICKGYVRIEYLSDYGWESFDYTKEIKSDKLEFNSIKDIETKNIKFTFLKSSPDKIVDDKFISCLVIKNISISNITSEAKAIFTSRSIEIKPYYIENVVIGTISAEVVGNIPSDTLVEVFVTGDQKLNGIFIDVNGDFVNENSPYKVKFLSEYNAVTQEEKNIIENKFTLLSSVLSNPNIPGVEFFLSKSYNWMKVKAQKNESVTNEIVTINKIKNKDIFDNSISNKNMIVYNDIIVDDQGISKPLNFGSNLVYGAYKEVYPGWWRPESHLLKYDEIVSSDEISTFVPDIYFNNIKFYKIFQFSKNSSLLISNIKLYSYQSRPTSTYYPHNITINKGSNYIYNDINVTLDKSKLVDGKFIIDNNNFLEYSIRNIRLKDVNIIIIKDTDYSINKNIIDFTNLINNNLIWKDSYQIELLYSTQEKVRYSDSIECYVICEADDQKFTINGNTLGKLNLIDMSNDSKVYSEDININGNIKEISDLKKGVYKFYCSCTDDFKIEENTITDYSRDIKLVSDISPMTVVPIDELIYNTGYYNNSKCSVITDIDGLQYIVVKEPSIGYVPNFIKLDGHYERVEYSNTYTDGVIDNRFKTVYTTGSNTYNNVIDAANNVDMSWNNGDIRNNRKNTKYQYDGNTKNWTPLDETISAINIKDFGTELHMDSSKKINETIFYNTSEYLPLFYSVQFDSVDNRDYYAGDRFLYKIELSSSNKKSTPIIDSVKFKINEETQEL